MSDSIKEVALSMALRAKGDGLAADTLVLDLARQFEEFLGEGCIERMRTERDEARARLANLTRELSELRAGVTKRALVTVVELAEHYEATDKLTVGAAVESAAARLGVTL